MLWTNILTNTDFPLPVVGASTPNVSQENAIFPGSLCPSYGQTTRLHGDRYETRYPLHIVTEEQYISR
jgi:hypothetical protein